MKIKHTHYSKHNPIIFKNKGNYKKVAKSYGKDLKKVTDNIHSESGRIRNNIGLEFERDFEKITGLKKVNKHPTFTNDSGDDQQFDYDYEFEINGKQYYLDITSGFGDTHIQAKGYKATTVLDAFKDEGIVPHDSEYIIAVGNFKNRKTTYHEVKLMCNVDHVIDCILNNKNIDPTASDFRKNVSDKLNVPKLSDTIKRINTGAHFQSILRKKLGRDYIIMKDEKCYDEVAEYISHILEYGPEYSKELIPIIDHAMRTGKSHFALEIFLFFKELLYKYHGINNSLLCVCVPHTQMTLMNDWMYKLKEKMGKSPFVVFDFTTLNSKKSKIKLFENAIINSKMSIDSPSVILMCQSSVFSQKKFENSDVNKTINKHLTYENLSIILDEVHKTRSYYTGIACSDTLDAYKNCSLKNWIRNSNTTKRDFALTLGLSATFRDCYACDVKYGSDIISTISQLEAIRDDLIRGYELNDALNLNHDDEFSFKQNINKIGNYLYNKGYPKYKKLFEKYNVNGNPIIGTFVCSDEKIDIVKEQFELCGFKSDEILCFSTKKHSVSDFLKKKNCESLDDYLLNDPTAFNVKIIISVNMLNVGVTITNMISGVYTRLLDDTKTSPDSKGRGITTLPSSLIQLLGRILNPIIVDGKNVPIKSEYIFSMPKTCKMNKTLLESELLNYTASDIRDVKIENEISEYLHQNGLLNDDNFKLLVNTIYTSIRENFEKHNKRSGPKMCGTTKNNFLPELKFSNDCKVFRNHYGHLVKSNDDSVSKYHDVDSVNGDTLNELCKFILNTSHTLYDYINQNLNLNKKIQSVQIQSDSSLILLDNK
jgi:hypothetical protein